MNTVFMTVTLRKILTNILSTYWDMSSSVPFIDPSTGELDIQQILYEAVSLGKLISVFALVSLVPFTLAFLLGASSPSTVLAVIGQFILAIGAGIVLMYVIARGNHLSVE